MDLLINFIVDIFTKILHRWQISYSTRKNVAKSWVWRDGVWTLRMVPWLVIWREKKLKSMKCKNWCNKRLANVNERK